MIVVVLDVVVVAAVVVVLGVVVVAAVVVGAAVVVVAFILVGTTVEVGAAESEPLLQAKAMSITARYMAIPLMV